MAEARFMQHTYMLSFQKASLATDLCFNFRFFGCNPPTQFLPSPLLVTLAKNNTLGEVDKINLRTLFAASQYDFHLWADDSKKGGNERPAVGVPHTWNSESQKPEGYILGYSLLSSGSDYHIIKKQLGILGIVTNVAGMTGDNAQTQTGHKSGLVK